MEVYTLYVNTSQRLQQHIRLSLHLAGPRNGMHECILHAHRYAYSVNLQVNGGGGHEQLYLFEDNPNCTCEKILSLIVRHTSP